MDCPVCADTTLVMADRMGVEIDYCPKCRGVWLDRGELDKLIAKSAQAPVPPAYSPPDPEPDRRERYDRDHRYDYDDDRRYSRKRKARSILEDIFDF